jgi:hypothetical protein
MSDIIEQITVAAQCSRLKIEWAKNYINHIKQIIEFLTSKQGHVVRPDLDPRSGRHILFIGPPQGIPVELPLFIGDAIHNLNSVMDYLWSGLARAIDQDLASKITFPRDEDRDNLVKRLADPKGPNATIKKAFPKAEGFLLEQVKPYKRRNDAVGPDEGLVWSLNKLDNISKHRLLIPTTNIIQFKNAFSVVSETGSRVNHAAVSVRTSGPSLTVAFDSPFHIEGDPDPVIDVIFDQGDHFAGQPVLETLVNLVEAVTKVVDAFENTFLL